MIANPSKRHAAALELVIELDRARTKHGSMRSAHEGYAVLLEEVDELWHEIKHGHADKARKEAVQIGAMALALLTEVYA